jgi:hypothetical protein
VALFINRIEPSRATGGLLAADDKDLFHDLCNLRYKRDAIFAKDGISILITRPAVSRMLSADC